VSDSSPNPFLIATHRSVKLVFLDLKNDLSLDWSNHLRSLHIEHVSPGTLISQEICRRSPLGQTAELAQQRGTPVPAETIVALMRRWFMARKPDAGFALTGFPATLLQARILDEWLDARDENLDAVVPVSGAAENPLTDYYRVHGLLHEATAGDSVSRL
jgi:adenylate kinase